MLNLIFLLNRGSKHPKTIFFMKKLSFLLPKIARIWLIVPFSSFLMDGNNILYVLGQFYGIETNFCGKGVLKTRENGHFWPFLRLLRNFSPLKPPILGLLCVYCPLYNKNYYYRQFKKISSIQSCRIWQL